MEPFHIALVYIFLVGISFIIVYLFKLSSYFLTPGELPQKEDKYGKQLVKKLQLNITGK